MHAPGAVTERMVVLIPRLVEKSRSSCSVHGGVYQPEGSPPAFSRAKKSLMVSLGSREKKSGNEMDLSYLDA